MYNGGSGGSGGTVVLRAAGHVTLNPGASVSSNGGDGGFGSKSCGVGGGGGGGGRIATFAKTLIIAGSAQKSGPLSNLAELRTDGGQGGQAKNPGQPGKPGTIYYFAE